MLPNHKINLFWLSQSRQWRPLPKDWRDEFFAALEQERTVYGAAKRVGVHRGSVYYYKAHDPEFAARLNAVLAGTSAQKVEGAQ